jgi:hypothetical protein
MFQVRIGLAALLALAACALSACNVVVTKTPLFSPAEASPAQMRDGIWTSPGDKCAFDETKPIDAWPECADPALVRHGELLTWNREAKAWKPGDVAVLFVAGEPIVLQAHSTDDDGGYLYAGIEPRLDGAGRIIALKAWPVLCGPPPPPAPGTTASTDTATQAGTKAPFPGMVMDEKGQTCTTADKAALRRAAQLSRQYQTDGFANIHWVRDGER